MFTAMKQSSKWKSCTQNIQNTQVPKTETCCYEDCSFALKGLSHYSMALRRVGTVGVLLGIVLFPLIITDNNLRGENEKFKRAPLYRKRVSRSQILLVQPSLTLQGYKPVAIAIPLNRNLLSPKLEYIMVPTHGFRYLQMKPCSLSNIVIFIQRIHLFRVEQLCHFSEIRRGNNKAMVSVCELNEVPSAFLAFEKKA